MRPGSAVLVVGLLSTAVAFSGCGGPAAKERPAREAAARFAAAVFRGDATGARALLARPDELGPRLRRTAARWSTGRAVRVSARRTGDRWTFGYAGRRTHGDGRFETERGDLVVVVAPSAGGRVRFFAFVHVRTRFSTHEDAQLLPSKR
jgi:hypothetical protein